mgnify:CR=1 FL=1
MLSNSGNHRLMCASILGIRSVYVKIGSIININDIAYWPNVANGYYSLGEANKIATTFQEEIETFDIPQTEQMKIPEPPARPSVPIASEDEFFDEDITIEDTDLEDFEDWMSPSDEFGPEDKFIPYDQAPRPKIPLGGTYL